MEFAPISLLEGTELAYYHFRSCFEIKTEITQISPRAYTQIHTPTMVQGVFDMLQYF